MYAVALRIMGDPNDAEEVLQEAFISACDKVGDFQGRSKLSTWLYRITTNAALMRLRKRREPTGREPQYVWTNVELQWEEHHYIEARYWAGNRRLKVTVNGDEIYDRPLL